MCAKINRKDMCDILIFYARRPIACKRQANRVGGRFSLEE